MTGSQIRTVVALEPGTDRDRIRAILPVDPSIEVLGLVDAPTHRWGEVDRLEGDVLVVACGRDSQEAIRYIERAVAQQPERPVIVLTDGSPNGFVREAFEAGADDIVTVPGEHDLNELGEVSAQLLFTLQKTVARRRGTTAAGVREKGRLTVILGPKGGTGKTLTACNLAAALAAREERVVIVDLDLQFGDVALALALPPEKTIYDLVRSGGSLDGQKVGAFLMTHASGIQILAAPSRPDQAAAIKVEFLHRLFAILRDEFDHVLIDTPPGFNPEVIAAIDDSTDVCLVGMLDAPSLKNSKLGLETLQRMGYDQARVHLLLNRADSRVGVTQEDVEALLGATPDILVPSHRDITRSVNEGTPIVVSAPGSEASRAFFALCNRFLAPAQDPHPVADKRRRLGRLRRRP
jgi:pilus assembly protein CpaE